MVFRTLVLVAALLAFSIPARAQVTRISTELSSEARASFESAQRAIVERDTPAARQLLERVIELEPDFPYVYTLYAYTLEGQPDAQRAATERFQRLTEAN